MMDIVEAFKKRIQLIPDRGKAEDECSIVDQLLANPPDELDVILEWIFVEHRGYVAPRVQAGLKFLERNPVRGWSVVELLINSDNPDDRDTAITVIGKFGDPEKFPLAKPLLKDKYPYLQFEAVELLKATFIEDVKIALEELVNHKTDVWVSDKAQGYLHIIKENIQDKHELAD